MAFSQVLVTELGVFQIAPNGGGMTLTEIAPGVDLEAVRAATKATFAVADNLIEMRSE